MGGIVRDVMNPAVLSRITGQANDQQVTPTQQQPVGVGWQAALPLIGNQVANSIGMPGNIDFNAQATQQQSVLSPVANRIQQVVQQAPTPMGQQAAVPTPAPQQPAMDMQNLSPMIRQVVEQLMAERMSNQQAMQQPMGGVPMQSQPMPPMYNAPMNYGNFFTPSPFANYGQNQGFGSSGLFSRLSPYLSYFNNRYF
jgi:hypothetical protein